MIKKIVNSRFTFLGLLSFSLSLCFALQLSSLSAIFSFLGASERSLSLFWLAPPITGLIIQPIIGQMSDDTNSRFGKRRPYILFWGILGSAAFALVPLFNSLTAIVFLIWIIGCSLNGCTEALRALTGDIFPKEKERAKAFAIQAFFAGIGGAIGASLPFLINKFSAYFHFIWKQHKNLIHISNIPINLKLSFAIAGFLLALIINLFLYKVTERSNKHHALLLKNKKILSLKQRIFKTGKDFFKSFKNISPVFKMICIVHSISWAGIFIFWLYFTRVIAQNIYQLPFHADILIPANAQLLEKASIDASFYNSIYQNVSIFYALLLYFIPTNHIKNILIHSFSILIGGIGMLMVAMTNSPFIIELSMVAYGIMWGSILILPYAIAMQTFPKGKLGIYLGIFNICITAPQIACGLLISPIFVYFANGHANYLLLFAGLILILTAFLWLRILKQYMVKVSDFVSILLGTLAS